MSIDSSLAITLLCAVALGTLTCEIGVDPPAACEEGETRSCFTGPDDAGGVGACRFGRQACVDGAFAIVCEGEVLPAAEGACNNVDDDCNGVVDDNIDFATVDDCGACGNACVCDGPDCAEPTCDVGFDAATCLYQCAQVASSDPGMICREVTGACASDADCEDPTQRCVLQDDGSGGSEAICDLDHDCSFACAVPTGALESGDACVPGEDDTCASNDCLFLGPFGSTCAQWCADDADCTSPDARCLPFSFLSGPNEVFAHACLPFGS